jgi:hypothetical protein
LLDLEGFMKSFRLDKAAFMADAGSEHEISALGVPDGADVTWLSDNPSVAEVVSLGNGKAKILAKSDGDAIIKAKCLELESQCIASVGYEGQNPIIPASWKLFIADGEPHDFDGTLYIYGSRDNPNGYMEGAPKNDWCSDTYHVIYSKDLIHWTDAGESLSIWDIPEETRGSGTRLWVPDIFKSPRDGRYYLLFCTNAGNVLISEGDSPTGPFGNVRLITLEGQPLKCIDPAALVDGDSVYIAVQFDFMIGKLNPDDYSTIIAETKVSLRSVMDPADPIYYPFEGPSLRKVGKYFYYIYIACRKTERVPTRMDYLVSENPLELGSWRYGGHFVETRDFIRSGNVHGSFEEFKGTHYLAYHRAAQGYERYTRTMNLDKLTFNDDGTANTVVRTSSGAKGFFRLGETIQADSACELSGGREDDRFVLIKEKPQGMKADAILALSHEHYAAYRYVQLDDVAEIEFCYRSSAPLTLVLDLVADGNASRHEFMLTESPDFITAKSLFRSSKGLFEARISTLGKSGFELAWFRLSSAEREE